MKPWESVERPASESYEALREAAKTINGKLWAQQYLSFVRQVPPPVMTEELMEAWFCNAIMAGYDAGYAAAKSEQPLE